MQSRTGTAAALTADLTPLVPSDLWVGTVLERLKAYHTTPECDHSPASVKSACSDSEWPSSVLQGLQQ